MSGEWYSVEETYGGAERCPTCQGRACLSEAGAERLVVRSAGRLTSYRCPSGQGWHVWAPDIEKSQTIGR